MNPNVFREYDIRGVADRDLTDSFARDLGRALGTFAILQQIQWAQASSLPHLYLGYWIEGHGKMDYKRRFKPLEALLLGQWRTLE